MSDYTSFFTESPTGATIRVFNCDHNNPRAIVHINHGMSEHAGRYERFAQFLNVRGYASFAHDHRGHGETTARDAPIGKFADKEGWAKVIADVDHVNGLIKERKPGVQVVLFGHSMGTIVGLNYCIQHSDQINAAALWNSGVDAGPLLTIYAMLLSVERVFKGSDVASQIANKLTFDGWNKKFAPNRTQSDWLSRDDAEVDKYIADPLCGFDATNSLWTDLLQGIKTGASDASLSRIRNDLPMHFVAGSEDPCTDNGKAVGRLHQRLLKTGIKDITCRILDGTRHESLNEINRDDTMREFADWLDKRFQ